MKTKRHFVDVYHNVDGSQGSRGQYTTTPTRKAKDVPCSITTLSGREREQANQIYAEATHKIEMYALDLPIDNDHWLQFDGRKTDGTTKTRKLHIGHIDNVDEMDRELVLLCSEKK